jgi:hypothetical protein
MPAERSDLEFGSDRPRGRAGHTGGRSGRSADGSKGSELPREDLHSQLGSRIKGARRLERRLLEAQHCLEQGEDPDSVFELISDALFGLAIQFSLLEAAEIRFRASIDEAQRWEVTDEEKDEL